MPTSATAAHPLALHHRMTPRDRNLLAQLDQHLVLTTDQIHRLHYRALRTCQIRLHELYTLGLLDRFRFARLYGGSEPWHWVLGLHGARFQAGATGRPAPTLRGHRDPPAGRRGAHPAHRGDRDAADRPPGAAPAHHTASLTPETRSSPRRERPRGPGRRSSSGCSGGISARGSCGGVRETSPRTSAARTAVRPPTSGPVHRSARSICPDSRTGNLFSF